MENQLSRGTIGLSPLSTALRRIMQHSTVRSIIIWPWKDHLASGLIIVTNPDTIIIVQSLSLRLLTLLLSLTCWPIMQKVRRYLFIKFRLLIELLIQTISLVNNKFFTISFTVLFTIAKFIILSLRGWFPYIPTS